MDVRYPVVFIFLVVLGIILFFGKKRKSITSMLNIQSNNIKDQLFGNIDFNKTNWQNDVV